MIDYAAAYRELHSRNPKAFSGYSIGPYVDQIAELVREHGARTLLDYGSGKGYQYLARRVHEAWGGILPVCYDPGVRQLATRPEGRFDGVICTDVLEHIAEDDVEALIADVVGYADRFVFFSIACRPAKRKRLPDGRNVHLTVQPPSWWHDRIWPIAEDCRPRSVSVNCAFDHG